MRDLKDDMLNYLSDKADGRYITKITGIRKRKFSEYDYADADVITDKYNELGLIGEYYIVFYNVEIIDAFDPILPYIEINKECVVDKIVFDNWRRKQYAITWL